MDEEKTHLHGGDPCKAFNQFGLPEGPVKDFSVNLNPFGMPNIIRDKWEDFVDAVQDYPSVEGEGIHRFYQDQFDLPPENILAGNGSTELIYLIPRVLGFKRALIITPSFHDYERASRLAGCEIDRFSLPQEDGFAMDDPEPLIPMLKRADALWLGRPNNPTGTMVPRALLLDLAKSFPDKWFLVDEAFIQFVDSWEKHSFMTGYRPSNMVIIHSLTKFYAIAGIRMGGVVADPKVIQKLRGAKEPWSINGIAEKMAPLLLQIPEYEKDSRVYVSEERKRVAALLNEIDGITVYEPSANFLFCQWTQTSNLDDLLKHLLLNGVCVRDCRNFPGLEKNCFRIGLRSAMENDFLISRIVSFAGAS